MRRDNDQIVVKTYHGLEEILAQELDNLGAGNLELATRAVRCTGTDKIVYRANLEANTAVKVLLPVHDFEYSDLDDYYNQIKNINWSHYLNPEKTFRIDHVVFSDQFTNTNFAALKMKDAIVDYFYDTVGSRPSIDKKNPDVVLDLNVFKQKVRISIDSSGISLHKRGYKKAQGYAPLSEILASGMLYLADFEDYDLIINPMCGSGTIALEAARMLRNIPPQFKQKRMSFMKWDNFDEERWNLVVKGTKLRSRKNVKKVIAFDVDPHAIDASNTNRKLAGMSRAIDLFHDDFFTYVPPEGPGLVILNPPYNERLELKRTEHFYYKIGQKLLKDYRGKDVWIISPAERALKKMGLKSTKSYTLYNGDIKCQYNLYRIHEKFSSPHPKKDSGNLSED